MSKIKSYEEACTKLGLDPSNLPVVAMLPAKHQKAITAHFKLIIIAEALNEGWVPNWDDRREWKHYPWFDMEKATTPSNSGFSYYVYVIGDTLSFVGSRLVFKSEELAEYAGKTFTDLYREYFVNE